MTPHHPLSAMSAFPLPPHPPCQQCQHLVHPPCQHCNHHPTVLPNMKEFDPLLKKGVENLKFRKISVCNQNQGLSAQYCPRKSYTLVVSGIYSIHRERLNQMGLYEYR